MRTSIKSIRQNQRHGTFGRGHLAGLIAADSTYLNRVGLTPAALNSIVVLDGPLDMKRFIEAIPSYKEVFGTDERCGQSIAALIHKQLKLPPAYLVTRWEDPAVYKFAETANKAKATEFVYQVNSLSHSDLNKMFGSPDAPAEAQNLTKRLWRFREGNK
ncbi:hypothetical protein PO124_32045 [Bacillus licheniformis]|nr:hypothetical protein [Bacillus licheniformis]